MHCLRNCSAEESAAGVAVLVRSAAAGPDHTALVSGARTMSYGELLAAVDDFAGGLTALGANSGASVGILLPNCPEFVIAYIGASRKVLETQTAWVEQMRQSARARYASGEGRQLDVLQAGLDAAMLREQLLDLDRDEAMRRAQLGRWIGDDRARLANATALPARASLEPLATLEERLLRHPAQQDFERRIAAAETATDLVRQRNRPSWMLDVSYGFRDGEMMGGESRPDMLSAMVSFDLPLFRANRQDREVAAARAETRALHEMHDDHQREMLAMLTEAWSVADRTAALERFYATDLLPLAEQSVQAALLAYGANRSMIDDVIAARRASLEASLKHLRLVADRAQAQYDIDYLVGEGP